MALFESVMIWKKCNTRLTVAPPSRRLSPGRPVPGGEAETASRQPARCRRYASLGHGFSRRPQRGQAVLDRLIDAALGKLRRHAHRILDGVGV